MPLGLVSEQYLASGYNELRSRLMLQKNDDTCHNRLILNFGLVVTIYKSAYSSRPLRTGYPPKS